MTENISGIPVVDFGAMSLKLQDPLGDNAEAVKKLADQVYQAFSTIGFVYLKNHGIPQEIIDSTFETYDKFFNLSLDVKQKYTKKTGTTKNGWDELERESTNIQRPGDLKESFDVSILDDEDFEWPNAEVPNFQDTVKTVFKYITDLGSRVLSVMAIGLNMVCPNLIIVLGLKGLCHQDTARLENERKVLVLIGEINSYKTCCTSHENCFKKEIDVTTSE